VITISAELCDYTHTAESLHSKCAFTSAEQRSEASRK